MCVSQSEISRVVTLNSSGTAGSPKRLFFTREDLELTVDFFHHGMSTLVAPGDRVIVLLPAERPDSVGDLLSKGLQRLGAEAIPHGPVLDERRTLEVMFREKVSSLVGIPTQVLSLARCRGGAVDAAALSIKSALLSTDHVPDAIVRELEHTWGCRVFNHYGMTEMGYGGGVECDALAGYHLREADLYLEIIDPISGLPVTPGDEGEIVFTTLTGSGMPLIRYRTGDVSHFIPEPCPCGTVLRRMGRVKERLTGTVELAGGKKLTLAELDEVLFPIAGVLDFEVIMAGESAADCLQIKVKTAEWASVEATLTEVRDALQSIPDCASVQRDGKLIVAAACFGAGHGTERIAKRAIVDKRKPEVHMHGYEPSEQAEPDAAGSKLGAGCHFI